MLRESIILLLVVSFQGRQAFTNIFQKINFQNGAPLRLTVPSNEKITYLNEETLREKWKAAGYTEESFSEQNAILKLFGDEEDDENEDVFSSFDSDTNSFLISKEPMMSLPGDLSIPDMSQPKGRSVGIDLGTTFSAVSIVECGQPRIIAVDGARIVPSVVAYLSNGSTIVGERARRQMVVNPQNTFSSVKRVIGKSMRELKATNENLSLLKVDAKVGSTSLQCKIKCPQLNKQLLPQEISAEVLRTLIHAASLYLGGEPITKAVITVPAYFLPSQCEATEQAGKLAGLEKVKLLREPEAAALAYGLTKLNQQIVLVFDLGGGTLDVSVLEVGGGFVEVIATSGDAHLGGDDFDAVIANWILEQLNTIHGLNTVNQIRAHPIAVSRIYEAAEAAKIALSTARNTTIALPFLLKDVGLEPTLLTKSKFESMSKPLLLRMLRPVREAAIMAGINLPGESGELGFTEDLFDVDHEKEIDGFSNSDSSNSNNNVTSGGGAYPNSDSSVDTSRISRMDLEAEQTSGKRQARLKKKTKGTTGKELRRLQKELGDPSLASFPGGQTLNEVILVGGATRIPAVRRLVDVLTGVATKRTVNPDEAVSLGAAVMAGILDGEVQNMQVMSAWQSALYRAFYDDQKRLEQENEKKTKKEAVAPGKQGATQNYIQKDSATVSVLADSLYEKNSKISSRISKPTSKQREVISVRPSGSSGAGAEVGVSLVDTVATSVRRAAASVPGRKLPSLLARSRAQKQAITDSSESSESYESTAHPSSSQNSVSLASRELRLPSSAVIPLKKNSIGLRNFLRKAGSKS